MKDLIRVLENMESLETVIKNNAPHGSGINGSYSGIRVEHYSRDNACKVIFENTFDLMDDVGFYSDYIPFRVVIGSNLLPTIHFLKISSSTRKRANDAGLREYLEEVFGNFTNDEKFLEVLTRIL